MFVIQFGVGILSHTEQLGMHCGDGEGWAQEELHCWPGWLKYGWFLLCLLPWKSHLNAESLRDLEQLFPQKMLWFGIYFADEGLESPWKSLSHEDLGSVWSRRNADGSLECPILPVVGIAVLPGRALWNGSGAGLIPPISRGYQSFLHLPLSDLPKITRLFTAFFWRNDEITLIGRFHRNGACKWIITSFIPMSKIWAVKKPLFMLSLV